MLYILSVQNFWIWIQTQNLDPNPDPTFNQALLKTSYSFSFYSWLDQLLVRHIHNRYVIYFMFHQKVGVRSGSGSETKSDKSGSGIRRILNTDSTCQVRSNLPEKTIIYEAKHQGIKTLFFRGPF
jgi:hypothetical protein